MKEDDIEEGFWVFVSHSTKDFERVRLVRNALEKIGSRPILLYLKCMEDEDEIDSLLKREIDARKRFILCDSPNARYSKYVRSEVKYIKSKRRMFEIIDLSDINIDSPNVEQEILNLIKPFKRRTTVFLSYSRNDETLAAQLKNQLKIAGFNVWDADYYLDKMPGVTTGRDWNSLIRQSIKATLEEGYFIALLGDTPSKFSFEEIQYACEIEPKQVLPVSIGRNPVPDFLKCLNILDVSNMESDLEKSKTIANRLIYKDLENQYKDYTI